MKIVRRSPFSGKVNEMDINVTQEQLDLWQRGELIQRAMPNVSADEREFIMTGITPKEWPREWPREWDETFNNCCDE